MKKSLRLSQKEIEIIKNIITSSFGKSKIYIFGSQTNLKKRGGDIDIFVIPSKEINFKTKLLTKIKLQDELLKPVNIIISSDLNRDIEKEALKSIRIN
jgi:predicted nucleotidyltransferase